MVVKGRCMITTKALKTLGALITKQPKLEQAEHRRNYAGQPEFLEQALKPPLNPSFGHGPSDQPFGSDL